MKWKGVAMDSSWLCISRISTTGKAHGFLDLPSPLFGKKEVGNTTWICEESFVLLAFPLSPKEEVPSLLLRQRCMSVGFVLQFTSLLLFQLVCFSTISNFRKYPVQLILINSILFHLIFFIVCFSFLVVSFLSFGVVFPF